MAEKLNVVKGSLADLIVVREKPETPHQRKLRERREAVMKLVNEAAAAPASQYVGFRIGPNEKVATWRAAVGKIMAAEPRNGINWGVRGDLIVFSKGKLPSGRGRGGA